MVQMRSLGDGESPWLIEFINQWPEFGPGYNWRTFNPILIEIEDDRMMGAIEFRCVILMLGIRVRYTYTITEKMQRLRRTVEDIRAGRVETVPLDDLLRQDPEE